MLRCSANLKTWIFLGKRCATIKSQTLPELGGEATEIQTILKG